MAATPSSRLGLLRRDGTEAPFDAADVVTQHANVLDNAALDDQGAVASRPPSSAGTPGVRGRWFRATDAGGRRLTRDNGAGFDEVVLGASAQAQGLVARSGPDGSLEWVAAVYDEPTVADDVGIPNGNTPVYLTRSGTTRLEVSRTTGASAERWKVRAQTMLRADYQVDTPAYLDVQETVTNTSVAQSSAQRLYWQATAQANLVSWTHVVAERVLTIPAGTTRTYQARVACPSVYGGAYRRDPLCTHLSLEPF